MIASGRARTGPSVIRATVLVASVAISLGLSSGAAAQDGLDALLTSFQRIEALECRFHEEKRIALLSAPIVTDGTIHYARPGRLARRVTSPSPQVVLIDGSTLSMSEGGHAERIDLSSQPVVRSFVDAIVQLLAGDRAALERSYTLAMEASGASGWRLTMRPRSAPLSNLLESVIFEGSGSSLTRMVLTETSGDVATTTFSDVDTAPTYTAAERARLFSLE